MTSKEYIKNRLQSLLKDFPQITFFYQFDDRTDLHQVLVEPSSEFRLNMEFRNDEADFIFDFDSLFFPESIVFISEDSLIRIDNPEFIIYTPLITELTTDYSLLNIKDKAYLAGENNYALAA
ncbi:MAG: hypothetical protein WC384_08100 [Prolixibacteraceae bacterium]|jgi:hypothetical protein